MSAVPVVDLAPFREGAPGERARVARTVDEALRTIGFFQVVATP